MATPERHPLAPINPVPARPTADRHLWEIEPLKDLLVILLIAFLLSAVYLLRDILLPVFIALVLAHVFNPLITILERRWGWRRPLTAGLVLSLVALSFVGFLAWLGPVLFQQFTDLARRLPDYLRMIAGAYGFEPGDLVNEMEKSIRDVNVQEILGHIFRTTGRAVGIVASVFGAAAYVIFALVMTAVFFFFLSWHFNAGLARLRSYIPSSRRERIVAMLRKMDTAVGDFFRGRLLISAIVGVLLSAGWFVAGVPYWFFLGTLTGVLNIVPFLSALTWPVAVLLTYMEGLAGGSGQSVDLVRVIVWPSAAYIFVQLLDNWVLTPWIQSGQTHLSAAAILLVVFIGGAVAGVWGLLFAIPLAACVKIFLEDAVLPRLRNWAASH